MHNQFYSYADHDIFTIRQVRTIWITHFRQIYAGKRLLEVIDNNTLHMGKTSAELTLRAKNIISLSSAGFRELVKKLPNSENLPCVCIENN